jgi:hypothetical protein
VPIVRPVCGHEISSFPIDAGLQKAAVCRPSRLENTGWASSLER